MVKSKLLDFEKTLEDEVCANVLLRLHKIIDESFPSATQASGKFSQTVVANFDKFTAGLDSPSNKQANFTSVEKTNPSATPKSSANPKHQDKNPPSLSSKTYSSPYSQQLFSAAGGKEGSKAKSIEGSSDSIYVKKSKPLSSMLSGFKRTKKNKATSPRELPTTNFDVSRADEIFSDRYLNKVARRSRFGILKTLFKLIVLIIVVCSLVIFVTGKQQEASQFIKQLPGYYKEKVEPKFKNIKSYLKFNFRSKPASETDSKLDPSSKPNQTSESKLRSKTQSSKKTSSSKPEKSSSTNI